MLPDGVGGWKGEKNLGWQSPGVEYQHGFVADLLQNFLGCRYEAGWKES